MQRAASAYILITMSSVIALVVILVLALLALSRWLVLRSRARRDEEAGSDGEKGPRHFDTTMGELRDLREALGRTSSTRSDRD